jgi:hypothetical protein
MHTKQLEKPFSVAIESDISYSDFYKNYVQKRVPVLLKGALKDMPAMQWSPQYMLEHFGDKMFDADKGAQTSLADFINTFLNNTDAHSIIGKESYLKNINVNSQFPELIDQLSHAPVLTKGNWRHSKFINTLFGYEDNVCQFFMGAMGSGFPFLHVDYPPMHTFSALFYGQKEWLLLNPNQEDKLYPHPRPGGWTKASQVDNPFDPDYEKYPLFANASQYRVMQESGDLLFVPTGWWHTARNETNTITMAWDHLNSTSWNACVDWRLENLGHRGRKVRKVLEIMFKLVGKQMTRREQQALSGSNKRAYGRVV